MVLCPLSVFITVLQTILQRTHSRSPLNIYQWEKRESCCSNILLLWGWTPILQFKELTHHSLKCKELYAIYLALKEVNGSLNFFSDSVYVDSLLPWLSIFFDSLAILLRMPTSQQERCCNRILLHMFIGRAWLQRWSDPKPRTGAAYIGLGEAFSLIWLVNLSLIWLVNFG